MRDFRSVAAVVNSLAVALCLTTNLPTAGATPSAADGAVSFQDCTEDTTTCEQPVAARKLLPNITPDLPLAATPALVNKAQANSDAVVMLMVYNAESDGDAAATQCMGTIINKNWLLTARHCFASQSIALAGDFAMNISPQGNKFPNPIYPGNFPEGPNQTEYRVYTSDTADLALVRLGFARYTNTPVKLETATPATQFNAVAYGWNGSNAANVSQTTLSSIPIKINSNTFGSYEISDRQVTVNAMLTGKVSDPILGSLGHGDSGGPLFVQQTDGSYLLSGILKGGLTANGATTPERFWTPVADNLAWINSVMATNEEKLSAGDPAEIAKLTTKVPHRSYALPVAAGTPVGSMHSSDTQRSQCAVTLIRPRWAVTSGDCAAAYLNDEATAAATQISFRTDDGEQVITTADSNYITSGDNLVAVVHLAEPVLGVTPAVLDQEDLDQNNKAKVFFGDRGAYGTVEVNWQRDSAWLSASSPVPYMNALLASPMAASPLLVNGKLAGLYMNYYTVNANLVEQQRLSYHPLARYAATLKTYLDDVEEPTEPTPSSTEPPQPSEPDQGEQPVTPAEPATPAAPTPTTKPVQPQPGHETTPAVPPVQSDNDEKEAEPTPVPNDPAAGLISFTVHTQPARPVTPPSSPAQPAEPVSSPQPPAPAQPQPHVEPTVPGTTTTAAPTTAAAQPPVETQPGTTTAPAELPEEAAETAAAPATTAPAAIAPAAQGSSSGGWMKIILIVVALLGLIGAGFAATQQQR